MTNDERHSNIRLLMIGGLVGGIIGVGIASLLSKRAERSGGRLDLSTGEGIRLGLLLLGMLRQVADLASPDSDS